MSDPQRSEWYAVRKKHGADSVAGRQASKLIRLSLTRDKPERAADRARLTELIEREKARLSEMLAK